MRTPPVSTINTVAKKIVGRSDNALTKKSIRDSLVSVSGLIGGIVWLKWNQRGYGHAFPFGPFLAIAGIIQLLWPQLLTRILPINLI